jgi:hypothetical protein
MVPLKVARTARRKETRLLALIIGSSALMSCPMRLSLDNTGPHRLRSATSTRVKLCFTKNRPKCKEIRTEVVGSGSFQRLEKDVWPLSGDRRHSLTRNVRVSDSVSSPVCLSGIAWGYDRHSIYILLVYRPTALLRCGMSLFAALDGAAPLGGGPGSRNRGEDRRILDDRETPDSSIPRSFLRVRTAVCRKLFYFLTSIVSLSVGRKYMWPDIT